MFKSDQKNAIGDLLNNIAKRRSAISKMEKADEEEVRFLVHSGEGFKV